MSVDATTPLVLMLGTAPEMQGGVAAVVASLRSGGLFDRGHVRYVSTHVDGGRLRKADHFAAALVEVLRMLLSGEVSIVHAHVSSNGSFWRKAVLLWLARRFGAATIFHLHDGRFEAFATHGFGGPALRWAIRQTLESSDLVVVLSERWTPWLRKFAPRSRVQVICNPVQCPVTVNDSRVSAQSCAGGGRILFLGKICEAKGSFDLLSAFAQFRARVPGWRLVVGGNGDVERFLDESERLGVRDDIEYLGWVSGVDKERELHAADIFVLPSYSEGMPVSILEAMAYASAVIATPVGSVPDMMLPDRDGLWVEPGDVSGLAGCLERLARQPDLRARLGAASRERVLTHFSVETVVTAILKAYVEVAERRGI